MRADVGSKYIQTHFFDTAFGERPGSIAGTGNHAWTGRDDMAELYFRDWDHLKACFESEHVRKTVGPDGANFNDLETAIHLMAIEKTLNFHTTIKPSSWLEEGYRTVAVLFLATTSKDTGGQLEQIFSPALINALHKDAAGDVYGVQANVGIPSSQFDIRAYFGGTNMPEYPVTYKIYLKDGGSVAAVRKAQKVFMKEMYDQIDTSNTFVAFGKEGLVLDSRNGVKVSTTTLCRASYVHTDMH